MQKWILKDKSGQHAPKYRSPPANEKSLVVFSFFLKSKNTKFINPLIEKVVSIRRIVRIFYKKISLNSI
jgi:hypothetical protein